MPKSDKFRKAPRRTPKSRLHFLISAYVILEKENPWRTVSNSFAAYGARAAVFWYNYLMLGSRVHRTRAWTVAVLAAFVVLVSSGAVPVSDRFRSPRNRERRVRWSTDLIVLHTTEAPARSSLNKVSERGECHFCVTEAGQIFRIIDRDREAFHSGRSMWNGREDVDKFSVGIECVGYHNRIMPDVQLNAIRDLVRELKAMYRIPDERVVCHSHVAYGAPNRWHRCKHRGRKRCGMLFAMPSVRRRLGLMRRPAFDPDTRAHRLRSADEYLRQVLYGSVDTMAAAYGARHVVATKPSAVAPRPPAIATKPPAVAPRPPVVAPKHAAVVTPKPPAVVAPKRNVAVQKPAQATAKPAPAKPKAPAVSKVAQPSGGPPKSVGQLKARGYVVAGTVTKGTTASKIAGRRWKSPDTYYTIRDKVIPGSQIDDSRIENGMRVWMKK